MALSSGDRHDRVFPISASLCLTREYVCLPFSVIVTLTKFRILRSFRVFTRPCLCICLNSIKTVLGCLNSHLDMSLGVGGSSNVVKQKRTAPCIIETPTSFSSLSLALAIAWPVWYNKANNSSSLTLLVSCTFSPPCLATILRRLSGHSNSALIASHAWDCHDRVEPAHNASFLLTSELHCRESSCLWPSLIREVDPISWTG